MAYIYDLSDTWNAGGTTFYGIKMNVTNSASAAGSKLLSLQVSGSEKFSVDPSGNVMVGSATPTFRLVVSRDAFDGAWADSLSTYSYFGLGGYFSGSAGSAQIAYDRSTGAFIFGNGTRDVPTERMRIDISGNIGVGTSAPSCLLDVNSNKFRVRAAKTPSSASDTGDSGDICWDSNYIYVCVASNTWKRAALSTW